MINVSPRIAIRKTALWRRVSVSVDIFFVPLGVFWQQLFIEPALRTRPTTYDLLPPVPVEIFSLLEKGSSHSSSHQRPHQAGIIILTGLHLLFIIFRTISSCHCRVIVHPGMSNLSNRNCGKRTTCTTSRKNTEKQEAWRMKNDRTTHKFCKLQNLGGGSTT